MRIRTALLLLVALYLGGQFATGLYDWHLSKYAGVGVNDMAATCGLGESPLSVDGQPTRCMSQAQFDAEKLADRALDDGSAPDLLDILRDACDGGEKGSCFEAAYLAERMR